MKAKLFLAPLATLVLAGPAVAAKFPGPNPWCVVDKWNDRPQVVTGTWQPCFQTDGARGAGDSNRARAEAVGPDPSLDSVYDRLSDALSTAEVDGN